ncbi:MAG: branched-chain amino acid ABC transporter permease, partial [Nitrospinota bacterium]
SRILQMVATLALALVLLTFPFFVRQPFPMHVMITILMYVTLGQSWNIVGGYAGQLSFAHAVFFALGAYTSTLLLLHWGLTPWLGLLAGALVAGLAGVALAYPCARLRGHYFAMATLAFGEIMRISFLRWKLVGGAQGLSLPIRESSLYYLTWGSKLPYYYVFLGLAVLAVGIVYAIDRARFGIYLKAIQQDEEAMQNLGLDTRRYKLAAMFLSAGLAAGAGTLYAQYILYIDPDSTMPLLLSVMIIIVVLFGGRGTVAGPVLGAFFLVPLSEYTRTYLGGFGRGVDFILFGLIIVLFAIYEPRGLVALVRQVGRRPARGRRE